MKRWQLISVIKYLFALWSLIRLFLIMCAVCVSRKSSRVYLILSVHAGVSPQCHLLSGTVSRRQNHERKSTATVKMSFCALNSERKIQKLLTPPILISRGEIRRKQQQWLTHRAHYNNSLFHKNDTCQLISLPLRARRSKKVGIRLHFGQLTVNYCND